MILNFDESGNLGSQGRYFTIAAVGAEKVKPLENTMKRALLQVKKNFPKYSNYREIKASDANPIIRDYIIRRIVKRDVQIRYIVADLHHVKQSLKDDENVLYNYLLSLLIVPLVKKEKPKTLTLNIDKRTIKVKSINSFENYIKIKLNAEFDLDISVQVNYYESHNSLSIQAADYISNAIYSKYEYGNTLYYDLLKHKVCHKELFPYKLFGKDKLPSLEKMYSK